MPRLASIVALLALASLAHAAVDADLITYLPGFGTPATPQYSGYLNVDAVNGRNLHYWFVTAENATASTPVMLWLNGGPGCSSLDGFLYEMGPFQFTGQVSQGIPTLTSNPWSWNRVAHMLYLEAPAFVGFSYSNTPSDANTNDNRTAVDNRVALDVFFHGFPELASNALFIAGESYAGVYVPTLANEIRVSNAAGTSKLNLQGFMVGNGCTGSEVGVCSPKGTKLSVDYLFGVNLYSPPTHAAIYAACTGNWDAPTPTCTAALEQMGTEIGNVNIYNILGPCISGGMDKSAAVAPVAAAQKFNNASVRFRRMATHPLNAFLAPEPQVAGPNECIDGILAGQYLNTDAVRAAIHVIGRDRLPQWTVCTDAIDYTSNIPALYPEPYLTLIKNYRVLVFNGDHDACVPINDNEAWTSSLGFTAEQPWRPWLVNEQVAGYVTKYNSNFAFASVKGAGHMVPQYRPEEAFNMVSRFLANEDL